MNTVDRLLFVFIIGCALFVLTALIYGAHAYPSRPVVREDYAQP